MNKKEVITSLLYKSIERFSVKGLGFIISILLARLLAPEAFGQIAIVTIFVNLSLTIVEGGLAQALVQNKSADDRDYSTVFYICMALAVLLTGVLYLIAPLVARFYKTQDIIWPIRVYAFSIFFGSYGAILTAKIQREMRFKQMMYCSLTATVLSGCLAIFLAYRGAGIWTLVVYYFAYTAINCIAMMLSVRWVPKLCFSVERAKELYSYGWKLLASSMLCSIYYDIRSLIIGKRFSTEALGYYDRGFQIPFVISNVMDNSINSVMFPVMSKAQDDRDELRGMMRRTLSLSALLIFPAMFGLAAVSDSFISLLLTDKWLPTVPFMQILSISLTSGIITGPNLLAFKAMGRTDVYMKLELIRRVAMLVVLVLTVIIFDSVIAMAYSYLFSSILDAVICAIPNRRLLGYGFSQQFKDCVKPLLAAAVMSIAVLALGAVSMPLALKLAVQIIAGGIVYIILCALLKEQGFFYVLNMLKKMKGGS